MALFGISKKDHKAQVKETVATEVAIVRAEYEKKIKELRELNIKTYEAKQEFQDLYQQAKKEMEKLKDQLDVKEAVITELKEGKSQLINELNQRGKIIGEQIAAIKEKDVAICSLQSMVDMKNKVIDGLSNTMTVLRNTSSKIRDMITKAEMDIDELGKGEEHGTI